EGRSSDVLVHQDGRLISAFLLKVICTNELRSTLQEKIIQPSPDRIIWQIVTFSSIDRQTLTGQLTEKTRRLLGDHIQVQVDFIDDVSFSPTGKQNLVVPLSSSSREANS
ncbi:MAG: hypothetical protein JXA42_02705, partial [Anaerolineales bacterium]|nr:hypothetical protein [Anaerolineales bacterium]